MSTTEIYRTNYGRFYTAFSTSCCLTIFCDFCKNFGVNGDPVTINTASASLLFFCWHARWHRLPAVFGVKDVHAFAAEIHPGVANNLSAVSVPGAIVVACFSAVADAQVFCCCWRSSGTVVYPTVADVLAVFGWRLPGPTLLVPLLLLMSMLLWDSLLFLASLLLLEYLLMLKSLLLMVSLVRGIT
jgi:hypothetical protein